MLAAFIRGRLRLLGTTDGGRNGPIAAEYHGMFRTRVDEGGQPVFNDAVATLEVGDRLDPGQSGIVRLRPLIPESWAHIDVGDVLDVYEGRRRVGSVEVMELFPSP